MEESTFGRYRLIELVGRGGMGEVWRAFDTETNRTVALKLLPPHLANDQEFQKRFRHEALAAAGLNEPHVVPIHNFGEIDGRLYVDMRLISGRDLQSVLANGPLAPARAVRIIEQIASALHAAHQAGLVHRDVKPSNILLGDEDFAYLIDFGIAWSSSQAGLTGVGITVGTWTYLAPERLSGGNIDARVDVYALACVLYETLTGKPPFAVTGPDQLAAAHLLTPPPRASRARQAVPAHLDAVIATGMAKDPNKRFATTKELAAAARAAMTAPTPARPPSNAGPRAAYRASGAPPRLARSTPPPVSAPGRAAPPPPGAPYRQPWRRDSPAAKADGPPKPWQRIAAANAETPTKPWQPTPPPDAGTPAKPWQPTPTPTPEMPAKPWWQRKPAIVAGALALAVIVGLVVSVDVGRRSDSPSAAEPYQGPFFPACGGVTEQAIIELTQVAGLDTTGRNSTGCLWYQNGDINGSNFSFTWYRGSPIATERELEERWGRIMVEDLTIDGHDGFIAVGNDPDLGDNLCEVGIQLTSPDDFIEWSISFYSKPFPDPCEIAKNVASQSLAALTASRVEAGSAENVSAQSFPNLTEDCDPSTPDVATAFDTAQSNVTRTFRGRVCRWHASTDAGPIEATRSWFQTGSLDTERRTAQGLRYTVEERTIAAVASIVIRSDDPEGGCGVASDAAGVVGWWINSGAPGVDTCAQATALMETTLTTNP